MRKLTIEHQAAMGRLSYTIRAMTNGLRGHGEEFDLVLRAMMQEVINLCLVKYHGRSITSGQAEFSVISDEVWEFVKLNNPQLLEQERRYTDDDDGGN